MKIAVNTLVTPAKKIGAGEYLRNLLIHLQEIDRVNKYFIFTSYDTYYLFPLKNPNFIEIRVHVKQNIKGLSPILRTIWLHTGFLYKCRRLKVDLIHVPNTQLILWYHPGTISSLLDLREWRYQRSRFIRTVYRKTANLSQAHLSRAVITISKSSKDDIVRFLKISKEKITITYPGIGEHFLKKIDPKTASFVCNKYGIEKPYILSVASQIKHKNIAGILNALADIKQQGKLMRKLVLVGKSGRASSDINQIVSALGLEKDVLFTGYVPDEHLPDLYAMAKMFVFPSFWEGFGIPVLEAMSCGCPVICSNVSSLPEVVGEAALMVEPSDTNALVKAILSLENNPELENKLRKAGPERAVQFSYQFMAQQTLEVYHKVYHKVIK